MMECLSRNERSSDKEEGELSDKEEGELSDDDNPEALSDENAPHHVVVEDIINPFEIRDLYSDKENHCTTSSQGYLNAQSGLYESTSSVSSQTNWRIEHSRDPLPFYVSAVNISSVKSPVPTATENIIQADLEVCQPVKHIKESPLILSHLKSPLVSSESRSSKKTHKLSPKSSRSVFQRLGPPVETAPSKSGDKTELISTKINHRTSLNATRKHAGVTESSTFKIAEPTAEQSSVIITDHARNSSSLNNHPSHTGSSSQSQTPRASSQLMNLRRKHHFIRDKYHWISNQLIKKELSEGSPSPPKNSVLAEQVDSTSVPSFYSPYLSNNSKYKFVRDQPKQVVTPYSSHQQSTSRELLENKSSVSLQSLSMKRVIGYTICRSGDKLMEMDFSEGSPSPPRKTYSAEHIDSLDSPCPPRKTLKVEPKNISTPYSSHPEHISRKLPVNRISDKSSVSLSKKEGIGHTNCRSTSALKRVYPASNGCSDETRFHYPPTKMLKNSAPSPENPTSKESTKVLSAVRKNHRKDCDTEEEDTSTLRQELLKDVEEKIKTKVEAPSDENAPPGTPPGQAGAYSKSSQASFMTEVECNQDNVQECSIVPNVCQEEKQTIVSPFPDLSKDASVFKEPQSLAELCNMKLSLTGSHTESETWSLDGHIAQQSEKYSVPDDVTTNQSSQEEGETLSKYDHKNDRVSDMKTQICAPDEMPHHVGFEDIINPSEIRDLYSDKENRYTTPSQGYLNAQSDLNESALSVSFHLAHSRDPLPSCVSAVNISSVKSPVPTENIIQADLEVCQPVKHIKESPHMLSHLKSPLVSSESRSSKQTPKLSPKSSISDYQRLGPSIETAPSKSGGKTELISTNGTRKHTGVTDSSTFKIAEPTAEQSSVQHVIITDDARNSSSLNNHPSHTGSSSQSHTPLASSQLMNVHGLPVHSQVLGPLNSSSDSEDGGDDVREMQIVELTGPVEPEKQNSDVSLGTQFWLRSITFDERTSKKKKRRHAYRAGPVVSLREKNKNSGTSKRDKIWQKLI